MSKFTNKSNKSYCCCCGKPKNKSKIQEKYNNQLIKCKSCYNDEKNQHYFLNLISSETLNEYIQKQLKLLKYKFIYNYCIYTGKELPTCDINFRKENIKKYIKNRNDTKYNTKLWKY